MKQCVARFLAVWLFLGSLFPQTNFKELCKVPTLLFHYQDAHTNISFSDYLALHYGESKEAHQCPEHENLPMQTHTYTCQSMVFIYFEFFFVLPALPTEIQNVPFGIFRQVRYCFQPENALFSPPKFRLV